MNKIESRRKNLTDFLICVFEILLTKLFSDVRNQNKRIAKET